MFSLSLAIRCPQYETDVITVERRCDYTAVAPANPEPDRWSPDVGSPAGRLTVLLLDVGRLDAYRRLEVVLCGFGHLLVICSLVRCGGRA
jgi:hypothetical protein